MHPGASRYSRISPRAVVLTTALLLAAGVLPAGSAAAASQPVVTSVSPGSGTTGTRVTISGSGFNYGCASGRTGQVLFGGTAAAATVTDTSATATAPSRTAGPVDIRMVDCSGDVSGLSTADRFVYQPPVVTSVAPSSGTAGTRVTVTGSGFNYGCAGGRTGQVLFGGVTAAATVTDTGATATAPSHAAGPIDIRVQNCNGDGSAVSSADRFVYLPPVVDAVSPRTGTVGTHVTVTGSGFNYGCGGGRTGQVLFGGTPAAAAAVGDTSATATAPSHAAGPVDVRVQNCDGDVSAISSADRFVYEPPVVASVSPRSGTVGTRVTVRGAGLNFGCAGGRTGQVLFGGIPATGATVTDTSATATAPSHAAGPVDIRVRDCKGDVSGISGADRYTYLPPGPMFFGLHLHGTERRGATVIARLFTARVVALRVMRVVGHGRRLAFVGLVRLGHRHRGRSFMRWNFRVHHRILGPGRYVLTLHTLRGGLLSQPAFSGAHTLLVLKRHRVRLVR